MFDVGFRLSDVAVVVAAAVVVVKD